MSSQFHNRLVGVTILVTSVVIFLPSIIDGKKASYEDEFVATPIKPPLQEHAQPTKVITSHVGTSEIVVPEMPKTQSKENVAVVENNNWEIKEVAEPVTLSSSIVEPQKQKKAQVVATPSVIPKTAIPEQAWTIQLGAFQNAQNINVLLKKLHKAGYQAHTIPTEVIEGKLTRVFVGPELSKSKLEKMLPRLKKLTKLQGKLLPFDAVNP